MEMMNDVLLFFGALALNFGAEIPTGILSSESDLRSAAKSVGDKSHVRSYDRLNEGPVV